MSICKRIAELVGGTIKVESTYEKGSRSTVSVCPRVQEIKVGDGVLAGLRVLMVNDGEITCRNTCERLEELQMTAKGVSDGQTAISEAETAHTVYQDYFVIPLNYRVPGLGGMETAWQIQEKVGNGLPTIMLSAYDLSDQMDIAKKAGANGFITRSLFRSRFVYRLE